MFSPISTYEGQLDDLSSLLYHNTQSLYNWLKYYFAWLQSTGSCYGNTNLVILPILQNCQNWPFLVAIFCRSSTYGPYLYTWRQRRISIYYISKIKYLGNAYDFCWENNKRGRGPKFCISAKFNFFSTSYPLFLYLRTFKAE